MGSKSSSAGGLILQLKVTDMNKFFPFTFQVAAHSTRISEKKEKSRYGRALHEFRDGSVYLELSDVLVECGYSLGEVYLNLSGFAADVPLASEPSPGNGDLVVIGTRPPLDEKFRAIDKGGHQFESDILDSIRKHFLSECSRKRVCIRDELGDLLDQDVDTRAEIDFRPKGGAHAGDKWRKVYNVSDKFDVGYLLFDPDVCGLRLLSVFGIGGVEAWYWARMLRTRHELRSLLTQILKSGLRYFVMVEWVPIDSPARPASIAFTDDISIRVVLVASGIADGTWRKLTKKWAKRIGP